MKVHVKVSCQRVAPNPPANGKRLKFERREAARSGHGVSAFSAFLSATKLKIEFKKTLLEAVGQLVLEAP